MENTVVVFTGLGFENFIDIGGTGHWKASADRISRCQYVVCVRNRFAEWSKSDYSHGTAFLVGRNLAVQPSYDYDDRFIVTFEEYANINIPEAWSGNRNPVAYQSITDFNLNLDALEWLPFPKKSLTLPESRVRPLTIAEAKLGIAKALGISADNIEITIRA
jgi:hypothetical protein